MHLEFMQDSIFTMVNRMNGKQCGSCSPPADLEPHCFPSKIYPARAAQGITHTGFIQASFRKIQGYLKDF